MTTILYARENFTGSRPVLTKTLTKTADGWAKHDFDRAKRFDLIAQDLTSFDDLVTVVKALEDEPHACLVRGEPTGATQNVCRTLYENEFGDPASLRACRDGVQWLMLDIDKMPVGDAVLTTNDERLAFVVASLPSDFHRASFYYQWSSSAGLDGWETLSCHLWFWLDRPWHCRTLHNRAQDGDWRTSVDAAPFTANQIHYTALPVFTNCPDPLEGERSGIVRGDTDEVTLTPWVRIVESRVMCAPVIYATGKARFEALLSDVGPDYHIPLRKAVAHYVSTTPPHEFDEAWLIDTLIGTINAAPPGKSSKRGYANTAYLKRLITGAKRKFGKVA